MAEKNRLDSIIFDPLKADLQDLHYLEELVDKYPYAQFLRILISKISQNLDDLDQVNKLNSAAIFSADRSVLKSFFTQKDFQTVLPEHSYQVHNLAFDPTTTLEEEIPETVSEQIEKVDVEENIIEKELETKDQSKKIFNEVLRNLDVLKKLRNKYIYLEKSEEENISEPEAHDGPPISPKEEPPSQHVISADDEMDKLAPSAPDEAETDVSQQKPSDELKQPESTAINKEEEPNTSDPDYQKKLIDSFIVKTRTIARNSNKELKNEDELQEDLSLHSLVYESDIVSENLAEIFVKQGKREKAMEIYKKLIWKFPQKKAYFAARIKELKG